MKTARIIIHNVRGNAEVQRKCLYKKSLNSLKFIHSNALLYHNVQIRNLIQSANGLVTQDTAYLSLTGIGGGGVQDGGGFLFKGRCLLTFSIFRVGAYLRWALIRGWETIWYFRAHVLV